MDRAGGNLYFLDGGNIRKVSVATGVLSTLSLSGQTLSYPNDLALDVSGKLYVADGNRVRQVQANGTVTTIAGSGMYGSAGDGGPATLASLSSQLSVAVDTTGNVYIADTFNHRVRFVTKSTGYISNFAGTNGVSDVYGDGGPATSAALHTLTTVRLDSKNTLYIASGTNGYSQSMHALVSARVRAVDAATGIINIVYGGGTKQVDHPAPGSPATSAYMWYGGGMLEVDTPTGDFFVTDRLPSNNKGVVRYVQRSTGAMWTVAGGGSVTGSSADGGPATDSSAWSSGLGLAFDATRGQLYVSDSDSHVIHKVALKFPNITSAPPTASPTTAATAAAPPVPSVGAGKPHGAAHPTAPKHAKHPAAAGHTSMTRAWGTQTKRGNVDVNVDVEVGINLRGVA